MALVAAMTTTLASANKYNEMGYIDVSGKTVADIAKEQGMTLTAEETKELSEYLLTADISGYSSAFGMTADDLYRVLELTQIASNMYQKTIEHNKPDMYGM